MAEIAAALGCAVAAAAGRGLSLADPRFRPGRCCRWPVVEDAAHRGRHLFCAAAVPEFGDVYCAAHHGVVYGGPTFDEPAPARPMTRMQLRAHAYPEAAE